MLSDLRYALRTLWHSRGFTSIALLALALGIGANTAMFSVVYSVLLKPFPYAHPDRLTWLTVDNRRFKAEIVTGPDFLDWRAQSKSFDLLASCYATDRTLTGIAEPFDIRIAGFSESLGRLFGVLPAIGRDFLPEELQARSTSRPVIISDHFYRTFFHANRATLGSALVFNDQTFTVVGVLPRDFRLELPDRTGHESETEAIVPFVLDPSTQNRNGRAMMIVQVIGRLRPGVSVAAARAEMAAIQAHLPRPPFLRPQDQTLIVQPLRDRLLGNTGKPLMVLLGAVGFVLLIACANVANLMLARAASRRREIAVRMALGANRARLARQAIVESLVLALTGGSAGLLLAAWCLRLIANWNALSVPRLKDASLDPVVLLFAFAISTLTGVLFALAPALSATRTNLNDALKQGSSGTSPSVARRRVRAVLVIAEVALSLVLLAGAGLMVKSLWRMHVSAAGAAPERVLASWLQIANPRYRDRAQSSEFIGDFVARIESLPGVRAAAANLGGPFGMLHLEGSTAEDVKTNFYSVTPGFFAASGIRLLQGRRFNDSDRADAPFVAVINETLARRFTPAFPRESPLGRQFPFAIPESNPTRRVSIAIAGIVSDFRSAHLDQPVDPEVYLPNTQLPNRGGVELLVRANSDPTALTGVIRGQARASGISLLNPQTLADRLDSSIAPRRFEIAMLVVFASLAVLLALVGIYGVVAYMVTQRTREIGLRMALGAQRPDVVRLVLGGGLKLVAAGVLLGLAASLALTRFMESFLYGVKPTDAFTFAAVSLLLIAVAALAAWIPARRAAGVDPLVALRYE
jgi:putative ABC transport system permease protein